ncbi:MAG TPA: DUF1800 family protein, partial [Anaerolineae bacterium]|nr:DUF1800 family protein [Anaerolineae bacterium]
RFQKTILGTFLPPNQLALPDGNAVLDRLVAHPGTGIHVCRKLCKRFISDNPPESLVQSAAALFTAQKDAPDQLKQVLAHILKSAEFLTTWGEKVKRPLEATVSFLRATQADFPFDPITSDTNSFMYRYTETGQELFEWPAPNGYPDAAGYWLNTTSLFKRWRLINWLVAERDASSALYLDLLGQLPAGVRSAEALTDFWITRLLGYTITPEERSELVNFMAQGFNPTFDLPVDNDTGTQERVAALVALIMMTPTAQLR